MNRARPVRTMVAHAAALALRGLIRAYQLVPAYFFRGSCRFEPSCSRYAAQAVAMHGPARGSWLAARRICRCHPWGGLGYDPVPPATGLRGRLPASPPHTSHPLEF
jgi:putative membrane protein insertion efficiency factor